MTASKGQTEPAVPRFHQGNCIYRTNISATPTESYWRGTVSIPYLDNLIAEMNSRFCSFVVVGGRGN